MNSDPNQEYSLKRAIKLLKKQVEEVSSKLKDLQDSNMCVVCCENQINCVVLPCGHKTFCYRCVYQYQDCPVCRTSISRIVRCYEA